MILQLDVSSSVPEEPGKGVVFEPFTLSPFTHHVAVISTYYYLSNIGSGNMEKGLTHFVHSGSSTFPLR